MKRQQVKKIKALFLLLVFSLNTLAGFACSVGLDMGYNAHHHAQGKSSAHEHGKAHHLQKHRHHHQQATAKFSVGSSNDDCCSNDVAKFTLLDKSLVDNSLKLEIPVSFLAFSTAFLAQTEKEPSVAVNSRFQFVRRSCFLNDTDLRIAIQSFQI